MLRLEHKSLGFTLQLAQVVDESPPDTSVNPVVQPEAIALWDNTRLGPYSVLLKDAFEESQTTQVLQLNESDTAPDLVALERSLTSQEHQQGLRQQLITREKIALIVDADNPFQGTLTLQQVTQIFKGEITNWQQVGGEDRPLKLVNRPQQNQTRQALANYGAFSQAQFGTNTIPVEQDTTAEIVADLGLNDISYAPASEAIEQFNMRIITIDNVGVDDGRYPFSQPLHYIYPSKPSEPVQGFLDFLSTPDAQSAIEFAQSQPADPTRAFTPSSLEGLAKTVPPQTDAISAVPLEQTPSSPDTKTEIPATETSPTVPSPTPGTDAWNGFPLLLIFLGLGILGWLAFMRVKLEEKRKYTPRPAPNYAARLKAQGSNRDIDELKAIVRNPQTQDEVSTPESEKSTPVVPDLSLDTKTVVDPEDVSLSESSTTENSESFTLEPLWDDDMTAIQAAPLPNTDAAIELDEEDLTTLQSIPKIPAESSEELDVDDDMPLLQGVFQSDMVESADSSDLEDFTDLTTIQGGIHIDPLTGRSIEEEDDSPKETETSEDESTLSDSGVHENSDPSWNKLSDPWD